MPCNTRRSPWQPGRRGLRKRMNDESSRIARKLTAAEAELRIVAAPERGLVSAGAYYTGKAEVRAGFCARTRRRCVYGMQLGFSRQIPRGRFRLLACIRREGAPPTKSGAVQDCRFVAGRACRKKAGSATGDSWEGRPRREALALLAGSTLVIEGHPPLAPMRGSMRAC